MIPHWSFDQLEFAREAKWVVMTHILSLYILADEPMRFTSTVHMSAQTVQNYLRTYRKRSALTQRDVATLIGVHEGSTVARYETSLRRPGLREIIALCLIFQSSPCELFGRVCEELKRELASKAKVLLSHKIHLVSKASEHRRKVLERIVASGPP